MTRLKGQRLQFFKIFLNIKFQFQIKKYCSKFLLQLIEHINIYCVPVDVVTSVLLYLHGEPWYDST